ncbi:MAG: hypothetical protein AB9915_03245 [Candidatus Dojkabacteria bacterium]
MGKVIQRNWLLIITGLLVISSFVVFLITIDERTNLNKCTFEGISYKKGDLVQNYNANGNCVCMGLDKISCDESNDFSISYATFSTVNLSFSYSYLNSIDQNEPDYTRVIPVDLNHNADSLEIKLERESYCGENNLAPSQVGFYEFRDNSLILTTMTNRDSKLYNKTCLISNSFKIYQKTFSFADGFSVLYQNEKGQLFDLDACYYGNKLYASGDSFKQTSQNNICSCDKGSVICK